ncbi:ATP-dependent RNA helicase [Grosmannia clavigera kw1407]|uniref:RNA helicase n=1 Tax=Grosmannia clavigera (strain kw1407 / UAMH 11150) TaxID=655863 RepID=F0XE86_GROCL|nr:ATP-dependent RNA helicase [Grosmannia clavigera kw1407]EFX03896.1 ATP-dependent RNA helicase [Grosmannia clavigera kw1407]
MAKRKATSTAEGQAKKARAAKAETDRGLTGNSAFFRSREALPVTAYRAEIRQALRDHDVLIVSGETGSGKSTQLPQFLYDEPWCSGFIAVTQPRRIAATTLAFRVADEMNTPLPQGWLSKSATGLVGYSVRFDFKIPRGTRIKYMTEGMLLQEMLGDKTLERYSAIVIDEVHERSLNADLLLGFLRQLHTSGLQRKGGKLKVVIMSATAQVEKFRDFFLGGGDSESKPLDISATEAQEPSSQPTSPPSPPSPSPPRVCILAIPGRQFPVKIIHTRQPVPKLDAAVVDKVIQINTEEPLPGDVLVFLSGQDEIENIANLIAERAATLASDVPQIEVHQLFGQMSLEDQAKTIQPASKRFTRKVILATNVAETSITVPGVRLVIDNGKHKQKRFDARLGMDTLMVDPIARSSAIQRAGRAGREAPGKCYRLYTEETYAGLDETELPEVLRIDMLDAALTLASHDIPEWWDFPLMDMPDSTAMEAAVMMLYSLGAIDDRGAITKDGRVVARLPVSAPYGRVLLAAAENDCLLEAIDIIACLTAGDNIFLRLQTEDDFEEVEQFREELCRREGDLLTYLTTLRQFATIKKAQKAKSWCEQRRIHRRNLNQAIRIRLQMRRLLVQLKLLDADAGKDLDSQEFVPLSSEKTDALLNCFLLGFASKSALLAPDLSYVSTVGKHVMHIHPSSVLHGQKGHGIMYMQNVFTQKNYVKHVSRVDPEWIISAVQKTLKRP